jgi:L-seryl-tRNA(Ser) seleniumtransferase
MIDRLPTNDDGDDGRVDPARRAIPSVDRVLRELGECGLPRPLVVAIVRRELAALRIKNGDETSSHDPVARCRAAVAAISNFRPRSVINGTGIIVHTNLGRAVLSDASIAAMVEAGSGYSNLEFDLDTGERGGRGVYVEQAAAALCAPDAATAVAATIVNNGAAALVLCLHHLTRVAPGRSEVIVSRGELVQIGGGFRVPDVLGSAGAELREVGTTNQTSANDFAAAVSPRTAAILRVHRSNFYMKGFVASPSTVQLAAIAKERGVTLIEDLGSGATFDTTALGGGEREPTPRQALADGADLVTFSGDKLLGGPQAGIIAGRPQLVAALKREPFFRALRCDKLILASLAATLDQHLTDRAGDLPLFAMMHVTEAELRRRAADIVAAVGTSQMTLTVGRGESQVGGGALPRTILPSVSIDIAPQHMAVQELARRLRLGDPAVVGCVVEGQLKLDLRTIFPQQDAALIRALTAAVSGAESELPRTTRH